MSQSGGSVAVVGARLRRNVMGAVEGTASGLLIRDGVIEALGSETEIRVAAEASGIRVIDVQGATVTPGLFDSHTHPEWAATITAGLDLGGIQSLDELVSVLRAEAARVDGDGDGWVRGWNLEYELFLDTGMTHTIIEDAVGGRPTILVFYDLHTALATRAALAAAGITGSTEFADTSKVVVDEDGVPTGELREMTAFRMVMDAKPVYSPDREAEALRRMLVQFGAVGLTGGAIMDGGKRTRQLLSQLETHGQLTQRITVHHWHAVHFTDHDMREIIAAKDERGRLWQGGAVKLFSDGVIDTVTLSGPTGMGSERWCAAITMPECRSLPTRSATVPSARCWMRTPNSHGGRKGNRLTQSSTWRC